MDAHPQVRQHTADGLDDAEVAQGVAGLERVVEELALVEDAAEPGPNHELVGRQQFVPHLLDLGDLGEKAVATDVESPAFSLDGLGDASDHVAGFEDHGTGVALGKFVGGGEPSGAGTDDHDRGVIWMP